MPSAGPLLVWSLVGLTAIGCGGGKTHPIHGQVLFKEDSKPLTGGMVVMEQVVESGVPLVSARGQIQADGRFLLAIPRVGAGSHEGRHRAIVVPPLSERPLIHPRFSSFATSGLEFTVGPGKNEFTIWVEKP